MKLIRFYFIACLILAGCAGVNRPPVLSSSQNSHRLLSRTLAQSELQDFINANLSHSLKSWPPKVWDLDLLTLAAFYYHPDLDLAKAQWNTAKAAVITAGGSPNPSFGFTPEFITNPGGISPWIQSFNLDFPIETAGKRHYRIEQAQALAKSAQQQIATTAWQVRNRLQNALLNLELTRQKYAILQEQKTLLEGYKSVLGERLALGMASPLNTYDYQLILDQTNISLKDMKAQVHQSEADVAAAVGIPLLALQQVKITYGAMNLPPLGSQTLNALKTRALTNRSDVLAGLDDYAAAVGAWKGELAKRIPDLHLGPGYQWSQGEKHWSLGFNITLPIFNQNKGPIAEARSRCDEVSAKFEVLQAGIIANLDHAWVGYRDNISTLNAANTMLANQKKKLNLLETALKSSEVVRNSLVTARFSYQVAMNARLDALGNALKSLIALEDIMQGPLQNPNHATIVTENNLKNERKK